MTIDMKDLFRTADIGELHAAIAKGELSVRDIAMCCENRTQSLNPKYHIWVEHDSEKFLQSVEKLEKELATKPKFRPLEGMPLGVKDVFNTKEYPTQMGSPLWRGFTPGNDARVVHNAREAGALIAGKTVTSEFAVHSEPDTLNPFDTTKTPGTSSSGSAVGIALGLFPVALCTQTGASVTRPASFCGIYGFKPSFGLLPRTGVLKTTDSLDTIGFFTSRFNDVRRVFDVLRVYGNDYPISNRALSDPARQTKKADRPWRVLFAKTHTWSQATPEARDLLENYAKQLAALPGIEVHEAALPAGLESCHELHATIYDKCLSYYFQDEGQHKMLLSPVLHEMIAHGKRITPQDFALALAAQNEMAQQMDTFLQSYDIVLSLSTGQTAPDRDAFPVQDPGLMWTFLHLPSLSAPCFATASGMPLGAQFAARRYNDYLLLHFLDQLRQAGLIPPGTNPQFQSIGAS